MAELALGSSALGNAAGVRQGKRERAAAEIPIFVGAVADDLAGVGLRERHKKFSIARRRFAKCDRPKLG